MPELPEVEVVRAGLERHVVGATVIGVEVLHPRPVRRDPRGPAGFAEALTGRRIEAASALGAGLDWKTSLQELSAVHGLGVPEYLLADEGPDHMKTFTAQVRVGDRRYGNGVGRSKKEAEQAAAETAYGELAASLGVDDDELAAPLAD